MTLDDVRALVEGGKVEFFLCSFVELTGAPKAKVVPASHLDEMATEGAGFAGFAAGDIGQLPHHPDMAERRRLFIDCAGCVQDAVTRYDALGYTVVRGRHCGLDVRFSAVVDNISVRKLPQLLMLVTLRGTIALPGIVDALATPQNTEFYSPWSRLPHQVNAPGWPAHVAIRTGAPADRAMLAAIHEHRSMS